MTDVPRLDLNDGRRLPQLGCGVWQVPQEQTAEVVATAIGTGFRQVDGARMYQNEAEMGEGIRRSGVDREEIFVTTKIWNDDHGRDKARRAVEASVERIGIGPVDLCMIHWPCPSQDLYVETWQALLEMREAGLVRSVGVSNFLPDHLDRLIGETGVAPVLNQIELHPWFTQTEMRRANAERDIVTQAWAPLGRGHSFDAEPIRAASERTGKSPVQVVLRWHMQSGHAAIPRSTNPAHLAANFDIFDFELTDDETRAIDALDTGQRAGPDPLTMG